MPIPIRLLLLLSRQFISPLAKPVTWLLERFLQPPTGRRVFSYQRTKFASVQRPLDWYSVPFLYTPGGICSGI